ncbi:MAG: DJ-1/PfpI family protein [Thermodesulfobacteriota bacterium]|nr:DJ-1/PfpI family protein [Thermodesulfobacteriota bacterium]
MMKNRRMYWLWLILALFLCLPAQVQAQGKNVLMVIAHRDFQDTEFGTPFKMFQEQGFNVTVASSKPGTATGMRGKKVELDLVVSEAKAKDYDAVVFVGGLGVKKEYWDNAEAHALAREAAEQEKVVAAICWAPVILANAGVLDGKKATVATSGGADRALRRKGCKYKSRNVVVDGKIITANGPRAASKFAQAVIDALK